MLLRLIVGILVFVVLFWANNKYAPEEPPVRMILNVLLLVLLIVWGLGTAGIVHLPLN